MPNPDIIYQPSYDNLGRITSADYTADYAKFDYIYGPNTNNISQMKFDHRTSPFDDPCNVFSYDNLDRLIIAEYGVTDNNEVFVYDDLGNRDLVNLKAGSDEDYVIDANNNRYVTIDSNALEYDNAGNLKKELRN